MAVENSVPTPQPAVDDVDGHRDSRRTQAGARARQARHSLAAGRRIAALVVARTAATVSQDLGGAFGHLRRQRSLVPIVVLTLVIVYVLSGTFLVAAGEVGVVTRFGRVVQPRVPSGLRWHLPWPLEAARLVNVSQVRREGIGVGLPGHTSELHPPEDIQLLTGDENLLTAKAIVQYRIKEPADYLFQIDFNEDPLLRNTVKAAMTEIAGSMLVDTLLTSGRAELPQRARAQVQAQLDAYRSGLEIVSIDLQEISPPGDVAQAFRDVSSAAEEKNKLINDAQGYANSVLPQARGESEKRLREAEGYRSDVVNRARGEAQRFADVLVQYQRDAQIYGPEVTRYRLYLETMEKVLPRARKYVVEPGKDGQVLTLRLLDQLPGNVPVQGSRP